MKIVTKKRLYMVAIAAACHYLAHTNAFIKSWVLPRP